MSSQYKRAIHWFRRDLRLTDNTALNAACASSDEILPIFILSEWKKKHSWTGPKRQQFLCECLESLAKNVEHLGGAFVVRQGDAVSELEKIIKEEKIDALYFNRDVDLFGIDVENKVIALCEWGSYPNHRGGCRNP
ncbi:deoxyribodipyrimidine photo-lyase [Akkermansiaceae bacterium]|nr:deoxyribodipyrimidine photo-lyase [Akkermansiaceae bacterium]